MLRPLGYGECTKYSESVGSVLAELVKTLTPSDLTAFRVAAGLKPTDRWNRALAGQRLSGASVARAVEHLRLAG